MSTVVKELVVNNGLVQPNSVAGQVSSADMEPTGVTPGAWGQVGNVPYLTVDQAGRLTFIQLNPNVPTSTFAGLPSSATVGTIYKLTDTNRGRVCWNGTLWVDISNGVFQARDFNVKGDGVTDDGPAINTILTACATNGAGDIVFEDLTHIINTQINWPTNGNNISWIGQGKGLTNFIFTFNGGSSTAAGIVISGVLNTSTLSKITFVDVTFAGQANNDTNGSFAGIYLGYGIYDVKIFDCEFYWFKNVAVHISSVSATGVANYGARVTVAFCHFHDIGTYLMSQWTSGGAFTGATSDLKLIACQFDNIGDVPSIGTSLQTVTNVQIGSNVATITTAAPHGLAQGNIAALQGLATNILNGTWTITGVTSNTFTFAFVYNNYGPVSDSGNAWLPGNNFHATYINAQCGVLVLGCTYRGICSRLHLFGSGLTEPPVDTNPAVIANNVFDGCYGFGEPHVCWGAVRVIWIGNSFKNTGVSVGSNTLYSTSVTQVALSNNTATLTSSASWGVGMSVKVSGLTNTQFNGTWTITSVSGVSGTTATAFSFPLFSTNVPPTSDTGTATTFVESSALIQGNTFVYDQNVPAASIYAVQDGAVAPNVVIRGNDIVSKILSSRSLVYGVRASIAGSNNWTIENNTFFADTNQSYAMGLAVLLNTSSHTIRYNRIDSNYNGTIISFNGCSLCVVHDNYMNLSTSGAVQPIWDLTQSRTHLFYRNRINTNSNAAAIGPILKNWDSVETAPLVPGSAHSRIGDRGYSNIEQSAYWTPGSIASGGNVSTTIAVPGALPGNVVDVGFGGSSGVVIFAGSVLVVGVVTVTAFNPGSSLTLGAGNLRVNVKQMWPDWNDGSSPTGSGSSTVTFGSLPSNGSTATATVAISSGTANIGDAVVCSLSSLSPSIVTLDGWVSATNVVTVRATNLSSGGLTVVAGTLTVQTRTD